MRNRYRSQPNLQRTGARPGRAPLLLGLTAAGLFASILIYQQTEAPPSPAPVAVLEGGRVTVPIAPREATPAPAGPTAAPPEAALQPEPPSVALAQAPSSISQTPAPPVAIAPARAAPKPAAAPPARSERPRAPAPAMRSWRQAQERYDRAMADYAARERDEGRRWAEQYNVTSPRYCRQAARTQAFMRGCLAHVRG